MSSTHRGADRNKWDYYITPSWMVEEFLREYLARYPMSNDSMILDCCAGGDAVNPMPYPAALSDLGFKYVTTSDIREDSRAEYKCDYLDMRNPSVFDLIITNPPFDMSVDITKKAIGESDVVVVLQRINWIGSSKRGIGFWKNAPLKHVFAHNKRASFTSDGKKDSIEYAHFVFDSRHCGDAKFTLIL